MPDASSSAGCVRAPMRAPQIRRPSIGVLDLSAIDTPVVFSNDREAVIMRTIFMRTTWILAIAAPVLLSPAQPAVAQANDKQLGKVHFETSCKPAAQEAFDRAMTYQHSFWYRAS